MPFFIIIVGVVLLVTAYNNTFGNLTSALGQDVPSFGKWFLALALVGALGYIPGMLRISRMLLALVLLVLVLRNYSNIFKGLANATTGATTAATETSPAAAYAASPASPTITTAEATGTAPQNINAANTGGLTATAFNAPTDPSQFLANWMTTAGLSTVAEGAMGAFA